MTTPARRYLVNDERIMVRSVVMTADELRAYLRDEPGLNYLHRTVRTRQGANAIRVYGLVGPTRVGTEVPA